MSNYSLVVPVTLALGVLYLGNLEVHSLRAEQATALAAERAQQAALLNSVSDSQLQLLKKVSDQQVDSLKDERSQWAAMQNFERQYIVEQLKAKGNAPAPAPAPDKHVKTPSDPLRRRLRLRGRRIEFDPADLRSVRICRVCGSPNDQAEGVGGHRREARAVMVQVGVVVFTKDDLILPVSAHDPLKLGGMARRVGEADHDAPD